MNMLSITRLACVVIGLSTTTVRAEGTAGETIAEQCVSCHGAKGISNGPLWPNIGGQHAGYLAKQLRDFKSGARKDPMMSFVVKPLSEQDIIDVATYFASFKTPPAQ